MSEEQANKILFESKINCIYRSGGVCKPPDNIILEEVHCNECRFYLNHISQSEAEKAIEDISQGFSINAMGKHVNHPKSLNHVKVDPEITLISTLYLNEDYISQCISLSSFWNRIMQTSIASLVGGMYGSSGHWISQSIFGKHHTDLTLFQLFLLSLSIRILFYQNLYETKQFCKTCMEEDNKHIPVKFRQKHCKNNHFVGNGLNRITKHYFREDKEKNCVISDLDFRVLSLVEWYTDDFKSLMETKKILEDKLRKQKGK